ncbi:sulfotransferase 2B1-like, partial [Discoglossus pictus]
MSFDYFMYKGVKFPSGIYSEDVIRFAENEFQVLDDDIFNVTYPKSGTNWMAEILNLIKHNGDPTWCKIVPNWLRSPWYETKDGMEDLVNVPFPRVISSHLPIHIFAKSFFTSKAKIIYTMRNPKDVVVSLYHFAKIICFYKDPENFQAFLEHFLQGE